MNILNPLEHIPPGTVGIVGIPLDENSSFRGGAARGPEAIRNALTSPAGNLCAENGLDLSTHEGFGDLGDLNPGVGPDAMERISKAVKNLLENSLRVLALGGDHSITYPVFKAVYEFRGAITLLQFDAHPDLYHEYDGNAYSHACPFARIMETCPETRLIQVGVRSITPHQREQAHRFGVKFIEMRNWHAGAIPLMNTPVYISLDLDALDPAFAPGVSHPEPGGLTTRDILNVIQDLGGAVVGADIVELNPVLDINGITAGVAAKFLKELAGSMLAVGSAEGY
jgi:agmatinase